LFDFARRLKGGGAVIDRGPRVAFRTGEGIFGREPS